MIFRRLAAAALALTLALPASAGSLRRGLPAAVALDLPFDRFGSYIEDDANTVAHWISDCGADKTFCDTKGLTWTMQGTVPRTTSSPLYPNGFGAGRRFVGNYGSGHFSSASAFDFSGAYTICFAFNPATLTATDILLDSGNGATLGFDVRLDLGSGKFALLTRGAAPAVTYSSTTVTPGRLNVGCVASTGSAAYVKLNGDTTATQAINAVSPATSNDALLGSAAAGNPFTGTIYEVWATTTPWNEASVAAIQHAALNDGGKGGAKLFPDDANTVLHVVGNDYTGGATWGPLTKVGTVGYSDAAVPPIDGSLQRTGYGLDAAGPALVLGSGTDALDFAEGSICVVYRESTAAAATYLPLTHGGWATPGWYIESNSDGSVKVISGELVLSAGARVPGATNVLCFGRAGSTLAVKMNLGAYSQNAGVTHSFANAANAPTLGGAGADGVGGAIYELWASTTPPSDALFTKIQRRFFGMVGTKGEPVTVTRATTRTCEVSGRVWTVPAGIACINADGISVEPSATNLALNSGTTASWNDDGSTYAAATAPDGSLTAGRFTTAVARYPRAIAGISPGQTYTVSGWARSFGADPGNGVRLAAFDGAWQEGPLITLTSVWQRYSYTFTSTGTSSEGVGFKLSPTGAGQGIEAWGMQLETGPVATSYIPTAGTSVTRNADRVSVATPAVSGGNFCVQGTFTPRARGWTAAGGTAEYGLWGIGTHAAANSRSQLELGGKVYVYNDSGVPKHDLTHGLTGQAAHRVGLCQSGTALYSRLDGIGTLAPSAGVATSLNSTLNLGWRNASGYFNGSIRDFKVCRSANAARCK